MSSVQTIGPYRILEQLGHGGMGIVYRAHGHSSPQSVALKTVRVTSPRWLESIRREIGALTQIRHRGIVRVLDYGVDHGKPWYAMDLLDGESLRHFGQRIWSRHQPARSIPLATEGISQTELLSGSGELAQHDTPPQPPSPTGPFPAAAGELPLVLSLVRQICETLAYLHGEGLVNCDLKPENFVLVGGKPIMIDFGLVAHHPGRTGREAIEAQQGMVGTLPYMSPEQIRGEFVDARADLYSVGCLLYELVTGRVPFLGSPPVVARQHTSSSPLPPSELVSGVSGELDALISKLLQKNLRDRVAFADEAAAWLLEMEADTGRRRVRSPAKPYLYRPGFFGRGPLMAELTSLRDRAMEGGGSFVLLGGESGVGKTRLAMELTRIAPTWRMQVVVGECAPMSFAPGSAANVAPLHAIRPVLQAIADRCQEGGDEVIERLLGPAHQVLATYEPALSQLPVKDSEHPVVSLGGEVARQRLFRYLADAIAAFACERPLLWVLDDLAWADELSLAFLDSLSAEYLEATPIFILGTYRTEEPGKAVSKLLSRPQIQKFALPRLESQAVSLMIADMLALRERHDGFFDFVVRHAEGNPFFAVEYVRAAASEGMLRRGRDFSWQWREPDIGKTFHDCSVGLPNAVRDLITRRLSRLSPEAKRVSLVAAVIGREVDSVHLREVAELAEPAFFVVVNELIQRQVLQQSQPGSLRFDHDKLRELTYAEAPVEQVRALHARSAAFLVERSSGAERLWATIGRHFALGLCHDDAASYLRRAADYARSTHANEDAVLLYSEAIQQATFSGPERRDEQLVELFEALGDVSTLTGQQDEARDAYRRAAEYTPKAAIVAHARLQRKMGKTWVARHQHEEALRCFSAAKLALGEEALVGPSEVRNEYIQVQIEELWVCYWLNRIREMDVIVSRLRPLIDTDASPSQRNQFFQSQMLLNFRRSRYIVTEEALGLARAAVEACQQGVKPLELYAARLVYGLALLFNKAFKLAEEELQSVVQFAQRAGDVPTLARSLTYLALSARMRALEAETRAYSERTAKAASASGALEYVAAAHANLAWLELRAGNEDLARGKAQQALDIWTNLKAKFPFQWMALVPLLDIELREGELASAVGRAEALLAPTQQFLPGEAADALAEARRSFHDGHHAQAREALELALRNLSKDGYR